MRASPDNITTRELLGRPEGLHLLPAATLLGRKISASSAWDSPVWRFDSTTPGQRGNSCSFNWNVAFHDGSSLLSEKWTGLLDAFRRFVWSLFADPYACSGFKETTLGSVAAMSRPLLLWMAAQNVGSFGGLSPEICGDYLEDSVDEIAERNNGIVSYSVLWRRGRVLELIFGQGPVLAKAGTETMPGRPFEGRTAASFARQHATVKPGTIDALPDEVALPIMSAAWRLLGPPSDDIIRLNDMLLKLFIKRGRFDRKRKLIPGSKEGRAAMNRVVSEFSFSTIENEEKPWVDGVKLQTITKLTKDVSAAAFITIQSQVGMRVNELCGLTATPRGNKPFPSGIQVRLSRSGINEIFYLKGTISKRRYGPEPVEWVVGLRPAGSTYMPPVVRAIDVLDRLFADWREALSIDSLGLEYRVANRPRSAPAVGRLRAETVLRQTRRFSAKYAQLTALPEQTDYGVNIRGYRTPSCSALKTHQWRKTWARYVFKVDNRMIPAIAQQFQHLGLAMTEQGYIGNDPYVLVALGSERLRRTVQFFYEATTGRRMLSGRLAQLVDQHKVSVESNKGRLMARAAIKQMVETHDLRIWFADHGKCVIRLAPKDARCHKIAGTESWANNEPNYAIREPAVCLGCPCFVVDRDHIPFWHRRYTENKVAFAAALKEGLSGEFFVAKERMEQSAKILVSLGGRIRSDEKEQALGTT